MKTTALCLLSLLFITPYVFSMENNQNTEEPTLDLNFFMSEASCTEEEKSLTSNPRSETYENKTNSETLACPPKQYSKYRVRKGINPSIKKRLDIPNQLILEGHSCLYYSNPPVAGMAIGSIFGIASANNSRQLSPAQQAEAHASTTKPNVHNNDE